METGLGAQARATQLRRIMVLSKFFGSSPQKPVYENNLLETNKSALKKTPTKQTTHNQPPSLTHLYRCKQSFLPTLFSPLHHLCFPGIPLLSSLHVSKGCATVTHNAHHRSTLPTSAETRSALPRVPASSFPHSPQQHTLRGTTAPFCLGLLHCAGTCTEHSPTQDPNVLLDTKQATSIVDARLSQYLPLICPL